MEKKFIVSLIIPVRDRWETLETCLRSLIRQERPPEFEVIIIDDGSKTDRPGSIYNHFTSLNVQYCKQEPRGIGHARNTGLKRANGEILMFTDSDCVLKEDCVRILTDSISDHSLDAAFQLKIIGSRVNIPSRIEDLRLTSTQQLMISKDGYIHWINTSGFALKRSYVREKRELFDDRFVRGGDTILFVDMAKKGFIPRYVSDAIVYHVPALSLSRYISKHFFIGYYAGPSRKHIKEVGLGRLNFSLRVKLIGRLWKESFEQSKGVMIFLLTMVAYSFEITGRFIYKFSHRNWV